MKRIQDTGTAGSLILNSAAQGCGLYQICGYRIIALIKKETGVSDFDTTAFAGFSLGDYPLWILAGNHPEFLIKLVFSGSFWWRSKNWVRLIPIMTALCINIIRNTAAKPGFKFWLQTVQRMKLPDRNQNGIIDSIDDTVDLIKEWNIKLYPSG